MPTISASERDLTAPSPASVERFRIDFERVSAGLGDPSERIALAVSGGADSMAMLALAAHAFPGRVIAATVDHRLRPESAAEAEMVAGECAVLDVIHATLTIVVPPGSSGNLHDWARQERYMLLQRWATDNGSPTLSTAHHADDQAETFLMRAARGAGLSGLAGVRERVDCDFGLPELSQTEPLADGGFSITVYRRPITLLRPLLGWRRTELRAVAQDCGLPFVDDPSNRDSRFDRARFRDWLESADWIDPRRIARAAEHVAQAEADLLAISHWPWEQRGDADSPYEERLDVAGLPRGVRRMLARVAIESVRMTNGIALPSFSPATNIEPLLDALEMGRSATQAGVLVTPKGDIWRFMEAPARRSL